MNYTKMKTVIDSSRGWNYSWKNTYPVWWRRSINRNKISTSRGVIWDIIWADWRNSSEKDKIQLKIVFFPKYQNRTFCDLWISISIRGIQINPLDKLHVVQQRVERHEEWEADSVATRTTSCRLKLKTSEQWQQTLVKKSTHCNKIGFDFFCQQVALNAGHDVLEVESWDEPSAVLVKSAEGLNCVFLVKVLPIDKLITCRHIWSNKYLRAKTDWILHSWRLVSFLFQSRASRNHRSCQMGFSDAGLFSSSPPRTHLKIDPPWTIAKSLLLINAATKFEKPTQINPIFFFL